MMVSKMTLIVHYHHHFYEGFAAKYANRIQSSRCIIIIIIFIDDIDMIHRR